MRIFDATLLPLGWWNLASLGCVECRLHLILTGVRGPACGIGTALRAPRLWDESVRAHRR